jgi:hypothetical protein
MAFIYNLSDVWNDGATTFTGIGLNVQDSASAAASNLLNLQVGGVSIASVRKSGLAIFGPTATFTNNIGIATPALNVGDGASVASSFAGGQVNIWTGNVNSASLNSGGVALRSTSTVAWGSGTSVASADLFVARDAADTLAQRRGTNAQTLRVYNTFTDASNYERGKVEWASNVLRIGTEKAGTGTARALEFQTDGVTRLTISTSGNLSTPGDLQIGTGGQYSFLSSTILRASSGNGTLRLSNAAATDFDRLQFGGTTSSFPALKRNATALETKLADDSAYAPHAMQFLDVTDGVTAPGAAAGRARIYVDAADGDLKIVFADGTVKTIVTDT